MALEAGKKVRVTQKLKEEVATSNRDAIFALLTRFAVARVTVEFDGGGDSGQITEVTCEGITEDPAALEANAILFCIKGSYMAGQIQQHIETVAIDKNCKNLRGIIEEYAYLLLQETNFDWINNDGGFGTMEIIPSKKKITCDMNVRETISHRHKLKM